MTSAPSFASRAARTGRDCRAERPALAGKRLSGQPESSVLPLWTNDWPPDGPMTIAKSSPRCCAGDPFGDEACAAAFGIVVGMSPTIFRDGAFRFFFFSREEERLHVHVQSPDGEAKFWIEPEIELARSYRLSDQDLKRVLELVIDHEQEIRNAWHRHFDR